MTPLHLVLAHVTAANRPGSHAAVLVREIERLRAENAELRELCGKAFHKLGDMVSCSVDPALTDGEIDQYLEGYGDE